MATLMLTAWFIKSANRKAAVEAMTSFIHVSIPVGGADSGLDRWRLTVAKKIRRPMSCMLAGAGSRPVQFHSLTLAPQRSVTPQAHSAKQAQQRRAVKGLARPIFDKE